MRDTGDKLKLGKGVAFVKSHLCRLRQEDDTWEADFLPIPCSDGKPECVWMGMVLSHAHDYVLAQRTFEEPPTVNDLARLLADAMQRPMAERIHRPQTLYLRSRPEWAELLPHLKQIGIQVVVKDALPKWDRTFGDLQAQVEQALSAQAATWTRKRPPGDEAARRRRKPMVKSRKPATTSEQPSDQDKGRLYTLDVFIVSGPVSEKFAKKNPVISRTIQMRGDQTLEDLHHAIFDAFDRFDEHMYEFQFGKGPMDPKAVRYVLPHADEMDMGDEKRPAGRVDQTTLDSLGLEVGRSFAYWFDFGDDWWHQINVEAIEEKLPKGKLPKVTKKVGKSPPQYADEDE